MIGLLRCFGIAVDQSAADVEDARLAAPGDDGFDVVYVTLREADLERIPESRIHTALEASLNCEVHILTE